MSYNPSPVCPVLTVRQVDVAKLIPQGLSNKEIAKELGIKAEVVVEHIGKIFEKLGLESRMQLAIWTLKEGLVALDDIELPEKPEAPKKKQSAEYRQRNYQKHREHRIATMKQWKENNKERYDAYQENYYEQKRKDKKERGKA